MKEKEKKRKSEKRRVKEGVWVSEKRKSEC